MLVIPKKKRRTRSTQTKHITGALEHVEQDLNDALRSIHIFRNFSPALREKLFSVSFPATHGKGHMLFAEGQPARGVFLIEQGRVKLAVESADGKSLILHTALPGEIVGLPATISGRRYETTAETMETTQVHFVPRNPFLHWLQSSGEAGLRIAEILSEIYHASFRELRYLGLSTSAQARLARFLLAKASNHDSNGAPPSRIRMTHQQIAAVIGLSRETVTRLLAVFKRKGLVTVHNAELLVVNSAGLRQLLR